MGNTPENKLEPDDGYRLWLRYEPIGDPATLAEYRAALAQVSIETPSPTLLAAREELSLALEGLLGAPVSFIGQGQAVQDHALVVGTPQSSRLIADIDLREALGKAGDEGYVIVRTPVGGRQTRLSTRAKARRLAAGFISVKTLLRIQEKEARWWRDACLLYFQTFSGLPIPPECEQPAHSLEYYLSLTHYFVPGIRERRFG